VTRDRWAALAAGLMATLTGAIVWFLPVIYLTATWLAAAVAWGVVAHAPPPAVGRRRARARAARRARLRVAGSTP
jgi:hypothetical protein